MKRIQEDLVELSTLVKKSLDDVPIRSNARKGPKLHLRRILSTFNKHSMLPEFLDIFKTIEIMAICFQYTRCYIGRLLFFSHIA